MPFLGRALSFLDLYVMGRDTLLSLVAQFPGSEKKLRRAQLLLALRRALILLAKEERMNRVSHRDDKPDDLIDRAGNTSGSFKASSNQGKSVEIALELETMNRTTIGRRASTATFVHEASAIKPSRDPRSDASAKGGQISDWMERVQEQQKNMKEDLLGRQDILQTDVQELRSDVQGLRAAIDQLTRTVGGTQVRAARRASAQQSHAARRSSQASSPAPNVEQFL